MNKTFRPGVDKVDVKPYVWAIIDGRTDPVEVLSYPIPHPLLVQPDQCREPAHHSKKCQCTIMVRMKPGDPGSLVEVPLNAIAAIDPSSHPWASRERVTYGNDPNQWIFRDELDKLAARQTNQTIGSLVNALSDLRDASKRVLDALHLDDIDLPIDGDNLESAYQYADALLIKAGYVPGPEVEVARAYVRSGGIKCPFCQSYKVEPVQAPVSVDGAAMTQDIHCGDCKETWQDTYTLTEIVKPCGECLGTIWPEPEHLKSCSSYQQPSVTPATPDVWRLKDGNRTYYVIAGAEFFRGKRSAWKLRSRTFTSHHLLQNGERIKVSELPEEVWKIAVEYGVLPKPQPREVLMPEGEPSRSPQEIRVAVLAASKHYDQKYIDAGAGVWYDKITKEPIFVHCELWPETKLWHDTERRSVFVTLEQLQTSYQREKTVDPHGAPA